MSRTHDPLLERERPEAPGEWFESQRAYPNRRIAPGALAEARGQATRLPRFSGGGEAGASAASPAGAAVEWTPIGPRPVTSARGDLFVGAPPVAGRITALAPDPVNPDVAYAGAADGGVWKTTDGGVHWTPLFDSQPTLAVGALAVVFGQDTSTDVVYVGTGETNAGGSGFQGLGLFRSEDGGATWERIGGDLFNGCGFSRIVADRSDPETILATVTESATRPRACRFRVAGVYRTTDGGTDWGRVMPGRATDVVQDARDPQRWYVGIALSGVWTSGDGGVTWARIGGSPGHHVIRLAFAVTRRRLVAAAVGFGRGATFFARKISGPHRVWIRIPAPVGFCAGPFEAPQCDYDLTLSADPEHPGDVIAGGVRLFRLHGIGTPLPSAIPLGFGKRGIHVDVHAIAFGAPVAGSTGPAMWVGTDGGVYRAPEASGFENLNDGLEITQFYPGIAGSLAGPLLGGTQDNGSEVHLDEDRWTMALTGDGASGAVDPTDPNTLFTSLPYGLVLRSRDAGLSWHQLFSPPGRHNAEFIAPLAMDPSDPNRLYLGADAVYGSSDDGNTWRQVSPVFRRRSGPSCCVSALAVAPSDGNVLYAGLSWGGRIDSTVDGGTTWISSRSLPNRFVTDLWVDPAGSAHVLATLSGFGSGHVFESNDGGATWTDVSGDLPDAPANAVAVDDTTTPPTVFVGTDVGVFASTALGSNATWARFGSGLPNAVVMDLLIDSGTRQLIAATHGRSVFTAPIPSVDGSITYPLVLRVVGDGAVRTTDGSLTCSSTCVKNVAPGSSFTVDATPGSTSVFGKWRVCQNPAGQQCTVTVNGPTYATAVFPPPETPQTELTSPEPGVIRGQLVLVKWTSPQARDGTTYDMRFRTANARGVMPDYPPVPQHTSLTFPSWGIVEKPGSVVCAEARTIDITGVIGPWSDERCVTIPLDDRSLKEARGDWARAIDGRLYNTTATSTTFRGASLRVERIRATGLGLLAVQCPRCGRIEVRWRGRRIALVDLQSADVQRRQVIPVVQFGRLERGTLTIRVLSAHELVAIDGLVIEKL